MLDATINRRDAETLGFNELTERVIGACIEIHRSLGPGLLNRPTRMPLPRIVAGWNQFERQKPLPVRYKEVILDCGYRLDWSLSKN